MPTTYTHHRFGSQCLETLPLETAAAVRRFRSLYDTGVHGPDIFFYYHPLLPNPVMAYGSALHRQSARRFFENAAPVWRSHPDREAMLAYLMGFLTHFTLDSACHGYVNAAAAALGVTHNRIEAVFDAHLMYEDGLQPSRVLRGEALCPSAENAAVISRFFSKSERTVLSACRGQVRIMRLLHSPGAGKKRRLRAAIRALHLPGGLDDLFIDDEIPPELTDAMSTLDGLMAGALAEFPGLADSLMRFLNGEGSLPSRFNRDFE